VKKAAGARITGDDISLAEAGRKEKAMTMKNNVNATASEAGTPIVTADELVQELRALSARLPQFETTLLSEKRRIQLANIDERFVAAAANAIGTTPDVQPLLGSSDEELRGATEESLRWTAAIDAARALLANLEYANARRRQRVGLIALQAYSICKQLVRDGAHAARLGSHVAEMKRLNKFGRGRKAPQPAPAPQQQTQ
jgi:hypothetical protein